MRASSKTKFNRNYEKHLQHLKLKGLQPKTIEAYSRAIRRIGEYFDYDINDLSKQQLTDYFTDLLDSHSWSAVKLDLYGLKFYYTHVLDKPWVNINLIKPPKSQRLPDIVTVDEAKRLFMATDKLSYRVFYFTIYSLGLRAWAKACVCKSAISIQCAIVCIYAIPRAIKIDWCHCQTPHCIRCDASGRYTVTPCCCFPIATAASKGHVKLPRPWIAVACRSL